MNRYICDVCGCDMEKPKSMTKPMPTIFENLTVSFSNVQILKYGYLILV